MSKKAFKFNKTLLCVLILAAALLLAGCGGAKSTRAKADETVHTALFDFTKPHVISFLLSSLNFWLTVYHFDGIRYDAVSNLCDQYQR